MDASALNMVMERQVAMQDAYNQYRHEFQADRFAARQTSAQDLASALVKLYNDNAATLTPDPLHSSFYDSHPPAAVRIERLLAAA